ncbi:MAG: hypothetical protein D6755_10870 [Anaerolineae bacterium]|nr:MAG: hypothetical protein D6755_10870 [Anaerolineae bacterium]
MSTEGMRIGRYVVERRLPRTGIADAYLAVQSGGEQVVVKVYPPGLHVDAPRVERFAQMIGMLSLPVMAAAYEAGMWNGRFFIVTRYLPGGTLAERLRTQGKLPPDQAARILYTLALGLSGLHAAGMFHLNIKPENVLFDSDGAPVLTDFSIARFAHYAPSHSLAFQVQDIRYLSPEQLWDVGGTGAHSDIYALGAVYYAMLTGQPPHGQQREREAVILHLTKGAPPLEDVPRSARRILQRTLAPQSAGRFATTEDLAEALESILPTQVRSAVRTRTGVAAPVRPPRRWWHAPVWRAVGVALLFVLALAAGLLGALWQQGKFPSLASTPTQKAVAALPPTPSATPSPTASPTLPPLAVETPSPAPTATPAQVAIVQTTPRALPTLVVIGGADKLAFVAQNDIWVANLDGSELQRLTTDENPKSNLAWTLDGKGVAYYQSGERHVAWLGATGELKTAEDQTHRCTFVLPRYSPRMVRYSPNERFVAAVVEVSLHGRKEDEVQVFEFDENCQAHKVDEFPGDRFTMRGYSAKGDSPLLSEYAWNGLQLFALHGDVRHDGGDLVVYNMESHTAETYTPVGNCCYRDVQWSPDGQYLLFAFQDVRYTDPAHLYYVPFGLLGESQNFQPLPFPEYFFNQVGGRIYPVLRPYVPPPTPTPEPGETVASNAPLEIGGADKLALLRDDEIWIFDLDGSNGKRLTTGTEEKKYLRWSPDGNYVLYQTDQCLKAVNIVTANTLSLGCYDAVGISADGRKIAVRDDVLFPDGLHRPLAAIVPYNMKALQAFSAFTDLSLLGACDFDVLADMYRWSPDGTRMAVLAETSAHGRKEQAVQVFELGGCGEPSNLISTFPGTHFSLRGYSEDISTPLLYDFAWDGGSLFAINGNVRDGFGDLVLFDLQTAHETLLDPLHKDCCYRDMRWSPDGTYFLFATEAPGRNIELYYVPFTNLSGESTLAPINLPESFFVHTDPRKRLYPALRPVQRMQYTFYYHPVENDAFGQVKVTQVWKDTRADAVYALDIAPDGLLLANGSKNEVILRQISTKKQLRKFGIGGERHTGYVTGVAFSAYDTWLTSASVDSTVMVWRVETGALYQKFDLQGFPVLDVDFDPNGDFVATAGGDGIGRVNRIKNAGLRFSLTGHTGPILSITYSPDGSVLATGSVDTTARVWSASDGTMLQELSGHQDAVRDVAFSPDGELLATASWDGTVRVWRWRTGTLVYTLYGHQVPVWSVGFTRDGKILFSGDAIGNLFAWRMDDGARVYTVSLEQNTPITHITPTNNDTEIAVATFSGKVFIEKYEVTP